MRLDKFLKVSRIIKRRTIASEACRQGRVRINGKNAKAGAEIKPGDIINIQFGEHTKSYEVLEVAEHAAKGNASSMYREME